VRIGLSMLGVEIWVERRERAGTMAPFAMVRAGVRRSPVSLSPGRPQLGSSVMPPHMPRENTTLTVRRFAPDEWRLYRDLRLHALRESPDAFGSTHAHEAQRSDREWELRLSQGLRSPWNLPLVAEANAEPCGLAWVRIEEDAPAIAHLYQMWVAPEQRRQGSGRALLDAAVAWARVAGALTLALNVTSGNNDAVRLYERVGFIPTGERQPLRPGSTLQSQAMHLSLSIASDG
jgi:ribosomal protein S18 acetylase RimI-like enzyme